MKIALVSDELTRACLANECQVRDVTPENHARLLKDWRPDLLLVESAWLGVNGVWKYKIASYPYRPWRSNRALRKVVDCARNLGIPCVFWNKEDGAHFERFASSARLFDHIFTVDENAISRYRDLVGADVSVHPLMFAAQPAIHSPDYAPPRYNRACFVGSYSTHIHPKRRAWQNMLFSATQGLGLTVYDRNSQRLAKNYRYPDMPWIEVRPCVPHVETAQIYRDYAVSLNVNTVEDSGTMFSRRLIEILACGGLAATTPSRSVDLLFRDYCHVINTKDEAHELFTRLKKYGLSVRDREMAAAGADHVLQHHTWAHRLQDILKVVM